MGKRKNRVIVDEDDSDSDSVKSLISNSDVSSSAEVSESENEKKQSKKPDSKKRKQEEEEEEKKKQNLSFDSSSDEETSDKKPSKKRLKTMEQKKEEEQEATAEKEMTQVEKEMMLLAKYEEEETEKKKTEYQKKLDLEKGRRTTRSSGDKRKEALSQLKEMKQQEKKKSRLRQSRVDSEDDDEEEHSDDYSDDDAHYRENSAVQKKRNELRRRRKEMKEAAFRHSEEEQSDTEESRRGRSRNTENLAEVTQEVPVNWHQANHYMLRKRAFFEEYIYEAYFSQLVRNNYVRILIGMDEEGSAVYRFCRIIKLIDMPTSYPFSRGTTKKGIMVAFGNDRKAWKLSQISSRSLTQEEFEFWLLKLKKDEIEIPTHIGVKKFRKANADIIINYKYSQAEFDSMIELKKSVGLGKVKLGVERVRLDRDIKAAEHRGDFESVIKFQSQLTKLEEEDKKRQAKTSDRVQCVNDINKKNRIANQKRDLEASKLIKESNNRMTHAERMQFNRSKNKKLFLSQSKIDGFLKDGNLIIQPDGTITTANKAQTVEAIPEVLVAINPEKSEEKVDKVVSSAEIKEKEKQSVEFLERKPEGVKDYANVSVKIKNDDGTEIVLSAANAIKKKKEIKPESTSENRVRKGISMKEYLARVRG